MSDFIQDMKDATELFKKWADEHAILDEDFQKIDSAMQKHYDQRSQLFEIMLKILEQSDDSLADNWQRVCEQGLELLERLESAIPDTATADGLKGIGLDSFAEGEKKIWQENSKATIATIAEVISEIGRNDDDLAKQLEEDLKRAREEGRVADELTRVTFGDTKAIMRQLAVDAAEKGATKVVSEIPLIGEKLASIASKVVEMLAGGSAKTREAAKKKRAYKDILVANRKKIDDLKDELDDDCIENVRQRGYEFADSLRGLGSNGDYKAADRESFAKECKERLRERSEPAIEKAEHLYETVRPAYIEGLTGAFATLASDQATLAAFKDDLDEDTRAVYEALKQDEEVIMALREGSTKTGARATLKKIQDNVTEAIRKLKESIEDAEEEMLAGSF